MNFNQAVFEASFGTSSQLPVSDMPEICFAGRSNVGKSSLINKILNRKKLARVSGKPGKTITVNFYKLDSFRLVDLPGYGYAKISRAETERFSALMESYFSTGRDIRFVFCLVDMRHKPSALDMQMFEFLQNVGFSFALLLTKSDKLNKTEYREMLNYFNEMDELRGTIKIPCSSQIGDGCEQIKELIEAILQKEV